MDQTIPARPVLPMDSADRLAVMQRMKIDTQSGQAWRGLDCALAVQTATTGIKKPAERRVK